jgi:hypothetical protein
MCPICREGGAGRQTEGQGSQGDRRPTSLPTKSPRAGVKAPSDWPCKKSQMPKATWMGSSRSRAKRQRPCQELPPKSPGAIKVGAVRTVTEDRGPGRVRLCDANTFKRAAVIAALNRARFSLAVAGRIAYFLPLDTLLYAIWDPCTVLSQGGADADPDTGLPLRLKQPKADWFDPDKPAKADSENDWLIEIYEGRFVGIIYSGEDESSIFGDLRDEGTYFVSWFPFHRQPQVSSATEEIARALLPYKIGDIVPKWADPIMWSDRLNPDFLDYQYEDHGSDGDPLVIAAEAAARSPLFKTTVNVTLAIRKALRRYLGIEPAVPASEMGKAHTTARAFEGRRMSGSCDGKPGLGKQSSMSRS